MVQCYCGCRSVLCVCVPALLLLTYWDHFFICLLCEDDLFFLRGGLTIGWFPLLRVLSGTFGMGMLQNMLEEVAEGEDW